MRVRYTRKALSDLSAIVDYIGRENPTAAFAVARHLEQMIERLAYSPELGQVAEIKGLRRIPAGRFPYVIFYQVVPGREVIIHHIRHGARKPWTGAN